MTSDDDRLGAQLAGRLTYLLKRAFFELEDLHAEHLAPSGVNVRELSVLLLLDGREPESQQQAALRLGVDRTTIVGLLDSLEAKGLVERVRDETDRRRVLVRMTDEGMRSTYAMYAPLVEEGQGLFAHHTVAELTAMRDLLDAMRELTDRHRDGITARHG